MEIRALGALEVTHEGTPVAVGGRPATLLRLLAATHPDGITAESLADAVWPDMAAPRALNNVRVNLSKLRAALPGSDVVEFDVDDGRYHLRVPAEAIDVHRFRTGIAAARGAADAGDPRGAITRFEQAFAEWRGVPYLGAAGIAPLDTERQRLERLRLDALCDHSAALLADHRPDEVVRVLEPIVDEHPTHEALAGQLMLGLFDCSRQSDALQVFARVVDELDERHGVAPGAELRAIADRIVVKPPAAEPDTPRRGVAPPVRHRRPVQFVGRPGELDALRATWARAVNGVPQLALIAGEGGIGKSTLLHRFMDDVAGRGGTVLVGICEPDPVEHFQPFPQLVRDALTLAPATDTSPALLGDLQRLAPDLADRLPTTHAAAAPDAGRNRLFHAVASLLTAGVGPRLIVIDDVHWTGTDSVDLFRHVLRSARGQVMIAVTYRPEQLGREHPMRRSMEHGRLSRPDLELALTPMNRNELAALVDAVASTERRAEFHDAIDELEEISAGNPLRFCEVLRQLELEPGTPIAEILPEDFRALIQRRIERLDPGVRKILGVGSVLGRVFDLETAAVVAGEDVDDALDHLDVAIANGLVTADEMVDDEYTFAHPLIRNAIYYTQVRGRRVRTHIRCAELLDARRAAGDPVPWAEIAQHLVAARPRADAATTSDRARLAGDEALARFAHGAATEWYRAALDGTDETFDPTAVARLRLAYGVALDRSGRVDEARIELFAVTREAQDLGDLDLLTDTVVALTPIEAVLDLALGRDLAALAEDTMARYEPDDPRRVAMLRMLSVTGMYLDPETLDRLACEGERIAALSADPAVRYSAHTVRYMAALSADAEDRLEITLASVEHCREHRLVVEEGMTTKRLIGELMILGDRAALDAEVDRFAQHAQATSIPAEQYWVAALGATRALMVEASSATEELIRAASRLGQQLQIDYASGLEILQIFALRYQQGRSREVAPELRNPGDDAPPVVAGTALLALALADAGRHDDARGVLDRAVDGQRILMPRDSFLPGALGMFAGVAAACGSRDQRRVLRDALLPRADRFCVFGSAGAVFGTNHHWLARLAAADGDVSTAREHLGAAARLCDDAGARYWSDRARHEVSVLVG